MLRGIQAEDGLSSQALPVFLLTKEQGEWMQRNLFDFSLN